jgi:glycosyltransferase 2 family protein
VAASGIDGVAIARVGFELASDRPWRFELLTPPEAGRRNRRTIDGVLVLAAAFLVGGAAAVASSAREQDEAIGASLVTVFGWAVAVWRAAFLGALLLALAIAVVTVVQRRWGLARDLGLGLLLATSAGLVLGGLVESDWFVIEPHAWSQWGFPELRVAWLAAVVTIAGPELVRPIRILADWLVALAAFGLVALGSALPSGALAALALGIGSGAVVRLLFGTAAGVPPAQQVRAALGSLGVAVDELTLSPQQRVGSVAYIGHDSDGRPLRVRVLGRDAQDTQRLARRWRALAYRDPPRSVAVGRLEQVEHEALATVMAAQAGIRVPEVVIAALGPEGEALIVTRQPEDIDSLEHSAGELVTDETLRAVCEQVARLHAAGISHGRLNASNVLVLAEGPMLVDFSAATLGAPQSAIDIDVAELLVAFTVLVGPERALTKAVELGWADSIVRALPYLQRAALTPHLRDLAREDDVALKDLRRTAASLTGAEAPPELAPMRRFRAQDFLMTALVAGAAYLLITQLAQIGFDTIFDELRKANIAWVVLALILAQLAVVGSGISVRGAVAAPLPLLPCVLLQFAIKFVNLTVPSSAGRIGMNLRFLQRMGVPSAQALVAGAVDDASETLVQAALLLVALTIAGGELDTSGLRGGGPDTRLVLAIAAALVVSVTVMMAVPRLRAKVVPQLKSALAGLWGVARVRRKRLELFGGNVLSETVYALTLGAACHAYGVDLTLAQLILVNTGASIISGLLPVPGGIGAAEATISAGLIAMGVDESSAFAIALTHRLCTFYVPPIWGYASLRWLRRGGYV